MQSPSAVQGPILHAVPDEAHTSELRHPLLVAAQTCELLQVLVVRVDPEHVLAAQEVVLDG
jgi:hypothetical protein